MRRAFAMAASVVLFHLCPANAETPTIKVTVLNEAGEGVESVVYYDESGKTPAPWANEESRKSSTPWAPTDKQGIAPIAGVCPPAAFFRAHPLDIGSYFESNSAPCSKEVVLRVLSKQTPRGIAIRALSVPFTFSDGSAGTAVLKVTLDLHANDQLPKSQCNVSIRPVVNSEFYRVSGENWTRVEAPVSDSKVIRMFDFQSGAAGSAFLADVPNVKVSLPFTCIASKDRINALQTEAEGNVIAKFEKGIWAKTLKLDAGVGVE